MTRLLLYMVFAILSLIGLGLVVELLHLPMWTIVIPYFCMFLRVIPNLFRDLRGNSLKMLKQVQHDDKHGMTTLILIFLCSLLQSLVLLRGGTVMNGKFLIPSLHDTMWNLSLLNASSVSIPPDHPVLSGESLKNNHYFYPFFLAIIHSLTGISTLDLYFRVGPMVVAILLGLSLYSFSRIFSKNKVLNIASILFGYFGGNAAFLLPLILNRPGMDWKGSSFFTDQPFDQMVNPYSILGLTLVLFLLVAFHKLFVEKTKDKLWMIAFILTVGLLFGIKSFAAILVIPALIITFIFSKNKKTFIIPLGISAILFAAIFFLVATPGKSTLLFIPGWILTEMVNSGDKLALTDLAGKEFLYKDNHAIGKLLLVKFQELIIYLAGSLWVRMISLVYIFKKTINELRRTQNDFNIFLISIVILSLSLPLLFNLRFSSYNIIQFTPYSLVILDALIPIVIFNIIKSQKIAYITIVLVFLLSIPVNVKNLISKIPPPSEGIPVSEATLLQSLDKTLPENAVIVIDPARFKGRPDIEERDPSYVSALSSRPLYLGAENYVTQTGNSATEKLTLLDGFFQNGLDGSILNSTRPLYLYIRKDTGADLVGLAKNSKNEVVAENESALVVKVRNE